MKIRHAVVGVMTVFSSFLITAPVLAHVEQSDHGITAEMHLPPDDQAIAGRTQQIEFIFGDQGNPSDFSLKECDCSLKIALTDGPATTVSTQLDDALPDQLTSQTTFTRAGDYTLTLNGYTTAKHTQQFNLVYNLHVQPAPRTVSATTKAVTGALIGICLVAAAAVAAYAVAHRKRLRE